MARRIYSGIGNFSAIAKVHRAIKKGVLPPARSCVCTDCGKPARHYDHRDYNKPLEVDPVCESCNHLRGPAIPRKGYFAEFFVNGHIHYSSRKRMGQILALAGIDADLSDFPGRVKPKDWLPFKEALLEWEKAA